jgi:N-acetylneuraminic acid mutarotase
MPGPRGEVAGAVLDGRLYVAGGFDRTRETTDAFEAYDVAADAWAPLAPLPERRDHTALAAMDGRIWAAGGVILRIGRVGQNLWSYDPAGDRWFRHQDLPEPRYAHGLVALDGRLYAVGGVVRGPSNTAVAAYDPAVDAWSTDLAPIALQREHVAAVAYDGRVWLIGGRYLQDSAAVEAYDPQADAWERMPDLPIPMGALTAAVVDERIHVTGGERPGGTVRDHYAWNPQLRAWERWPDLPTPRHGLASGSIDGQWVVAAGGKVPDLATSDVVEIFTP